MKSFRTAILSAAYRLSPFSLKGDAQKEDTATTCDVSCVINFYGRIGLLEGILFSLSEQDFPTERFEVVLVEDRSGTAEGHAAAQRFQSLMKVRYFALPENHGLMGYSRNYGLAKATGKYILFLDDDTVIVQSDFLSRLVKMFDDTTADGIIPHGLSTYHLIRNRYGYHEPYFPTNRCMAYRRSALDALAGFVSDIIGQEDVEFVIRFLMSGRSFVTASDLEYYHPPLLMPDLGKAKAVGSSFYGLRKRYPPLLWFLLLLNGARHAACIYSPVRKYRERGRFGFGFLIGAVASVFKKEVYKYC